MKIAVIGANGFVGSNLDKHLSKTYQVTPVIRTSVDLLNPVACFDYFKTHQFDVVINAAAVMNNVNDTYNNLGLFMNIHNARTTFGKFINLGSGAEFDRTRNIDCASPHDIFKVLPADTYGFGQNVKSRICYETDNFYTIRIFNCFGQGEISTRLFPKYLDSSTFSINNDRYFDYFSIQDLCTVVEHCVNNTWSIKDVNAVYSDKYKISEVLNKFCRLQNLEPKFTVDSTSLNNYTGDSDPLNSLGITVQGLLHGLKNYNV